MSFRYEERLDPEVASALDAVPRYELIDIPADRARRRQLAASSAAVAAPVDGVVLTTQVLPGRAPGVCPCGCTGRSDRTSAPAGCCGCTVAVT
ncbi:hypothetical protein [Nocardioides sp. TF02-7]|uniref:hypothetical protein n=1 Tax=Nocardioides sp. TF02-7 TaxID=2917724 RepID=UPI001F05383A|nr:hypothetical protein [Nocardioides sp. TF02-7]UMG91208.1 hypothetical protein MF408_13560 [Nocardioides sp. TF02-7]